VAQKIRPAAWAASMFGRNLAATLMDSIPVAIQAAVNRQMDGHHAVGLSSRHAFGGAWPARYDEMVNHLGDIPGAQIVRPVGKSYRIVIINNIAVLPVEYAKDLATSYDSPQALRKINKTTLELARQFGPKPDQIQPAFDGLETQADEAETDLLRGLYPDGIVIVYYAAHERQGLLNIGWGQVSVSDKGAAQKGAAQWVTAQSLLIPSAVPIPGLRVLTAVGGYATMQRFDQAEMGIPTIKPRTAAQRAGVMPVTEQPTQQRSDVKD
jgi:hypothetical protein